MKGQWKERERKKEEEGEGERGKRCETKPFCTAARDVSEKVDERKTALHGSGEDERDTEAEAEAERREKREREKARKRPQASDSEELARPHFSPLLSLCNTRRPAGLEPSLGRHSCGSAFSGSGKRRRFSPFRAQTPVCFPPTLSPFPLSKQERSRRPCNTRAHLDHSIPRVFCRARSSQRGLARASPPHCRVARDP